MIMKKLRLLLLFTCFSIIKTVSFSQYNTNIFSCGYKPNAKEILINQSVNDESFVNNVNIESLVEKILVLVGLSKNFIIVSHPNIENAYAITGNDGIRYIVYDKNFINKINNSTTNWSTLSILAHEIGHHLYGHTITISRNLAEQRNKESAINIALREGRERYLSKL